MWQFIWLGLISLIIMSALIYNHYVNHIKEGFEDEKEKETPTSLTVDIVNESKVSQPPFPPCVGYVDEVVYAPSDVNANLVKVKADLANLHKNIPNYIEDGVNQQTGIIVKGILRQNGFPLTDDLYAQNDAPLNCN